MSSPLPLREREGDGAPATLPPTSRTLPPDIAPTGEGAVSRHATNPLGLIAGGGELPIRVAAAAAAAGRPVHVILLEGFADPADFASYPRLIARLGAGGRMLDWL